MYAIDLATATPSDIIRRSIVCHPSLLAERMREVSQTHANYSRTVHDKAAQQVASRLQASCAAVARLIEANDAAEAATCIMLGGMDFWIPTLTVAAKLQCIPYATIADVMARYDTARSKSACF